MDESVDKAIELLEKLSAHIDDALVIAAKAKEALEQLQGLEDPEKKKMVIDAVADMLKKIVDKKEGDVSIPEQPEQPEP